MQLNEYQEFTRTTAVFAPGQAIPYLALGLGNEAGEVQGKIKKLLRGDYELTDAVKEQIRAECGDVFWYLVSLLDELGIDAEDCLWHNVEKIRDRQQRGVLKGNGDSR